jgi:hypothetical protein
MDYKVPARAYIKKSIQEGRNPLLPNYVGHIGRKPVYEADGPLESMDDIPVQTDRGVREVTTEEWGQLKGYPPSWGTTVKDRRRIIQYPSLYFWSVLGDAFDPTLIHPEQKWNPMRKMMASTQVHHLCHPYHHGNRTLQMTNQRVKLTVLTQNIWNSPLTWTLHLSGTLPIYKREEIGVKHV